MIRLGDRRSVHPITFDPGETKEGKGKSRPHTKGGYNLSDGPRRRTNIYHDTGSRTLLAWVRRVCPPRFHGSALRILDGIPRKKCTRYQFLL